MTDTVELEVAIKRSGLLKKEVAQKLGISQTCLNQKIQNITEFKASEISKLAKLLGLDDKEKNTIFFA